MKHLVTGGSGYLGNLIARRLLSRGDQVRVLDVWDDPSRPQEIEFIKGDVCDRETVAQAMRGIDVVHHNAALVPLTKSGERFWSVNVNGAEIAAEEAARAGVSTFLYTSSTAIYGAALSPIDDRTVPRPIEPFGRSKLAGEGAVRKIADRHGMRFLAIRPRVILGGGRLGIFEILFRWIEEGRRVYVLGDGRNAFQFIHVEDLIDAHMLLMDSGAEGAFNVGTDRFGTLRETLDALIVHAETKSMVTPIPAAPAIAILRALDLLRLSPLAPWHYLTYHRACHFDVEPLLRLGWRPRYSNDEMLKESFDWYRKHRRSGEVGPGQGSAHRKPVEERLLRLLRRLS